VVTRLTAVSSIDQPHSDRPWAEPSRTGRRQQDRSRETQGKILSAAVTVLIEQGYSGASTLRIQQQAGVSRGRLLHHFPSREKLLSAAVHHLALERIRGLHISSDIPQEPKARIRAAIDAMWSNYSQPYFWASNELWNAARTNDELRAELRPVEQRMGQVIRDRTDALFGSECTTRPGYKQMRELLLTSMRGTAMTYTFDPHDPTTDRHLSQWYSHAESVLLH
jgi:AcrR family transcriptional regulator